MDVFTDQGFGGNGACVFNDLNFTRQEKQAFARKIGLSETIFIKKTESEYYFEYFTPESEVDLCGHGTIAGIQYIKEKFNDQPNEVMTKSGKVNIEYKGNIIYIFLGEAEFIKDYDDIDALSDITALDKKVINMENLTPKIFRSGISDLIMPVKDYDSLMNINISKELLIKLSIKENIVGLHCFTIDEGHIYARNFAPLYGIDEESATGTSNNSVICYLREKNLLLFDFGVISQGTNNEIGKIYYLIKNNKVFIGGEVVKRNNKYDLSNK